MVQEATEEMLFQIGAVAQASNITSQTLTERHPTARPRLKPTSTMSQTFAAHSQGRHRLHGPIQGTGGDGLPIRASFHPHLRVKLRKATRRLKRTAITNGSALWVSRVAIRHPWLPRQSQHRIKMLSTSLFLARTRLHK